MEEKKVNLSKIIKAIGLNFWNWVLDRWFLARRGEKTFHVIGKYFSLSRGPMIHLLESRARVWIPIEGKYFNEISPVSILRIVYEQTRIKKRFRIIKKTVLNPKTG